MAISDATKAKLNKMCIGAKEANLGTILQGLQNDIVHGVHAVIASEQTACTLDIDTGKTITGFIVQVYRAGVLLSSIKVTAATTILTVATNSTNYVLTTGDVIDYIVF